MANNNLKDILAKKILIDDVETSQFLIRNQSMSINEMDWPAQRRYLKFWLKQVNNALLGSKKEIGKAIMVEITGDKGEKVLDKDDVKAGQKLNIEVKALTPKEFNKFVMSRLKA